jgi:hypothetical protein
MIFISLFLLSFTSAQVTYSDCKIYGNCKPISTIGGVGLNGLNGTNGTNGINGLNGTNGTSFSNFSLYMTSDNATIQNNSIVNWITSTFTSLANTLDALGNWSADKPLYTLLTTLNNGSYLNSAWNATNTSYVPYTGANQNVNLGNNNLLIGIYSLTMSGGGVGQLNLNDGIGLSQASLDINFLTSSRVFKFPNLDGTLFLSSQWNSTNTSYMEGSNFTTQNNSMIAYIGTVNTSMDNLVDLNNASVTNALATKLAISQWNVTNTSYVPYTGANQNVDLGNNNLTVNGTTTFSNTTIGGGLTINGNIDIGDSYGPELITNGGFDDGSGWSTPAGFNISEGKLNNDNSWGTVQQTIPTLTVGKTYRLTYTIVSIGSAAVQIRVGWGGIGANRYAAGTYTENIVCDTNNIVYVVPTDLNVFSIDNISVKEVTFGSTALPILNVSNGKLYVSYAGKVGINTANPFTALHVNGNILANGTINATTGFGVNGNSGITGNYTILKDADLVMLTKTYCSMNFTGGILFSSTC